MNTRPVKIFALRNRITGQVYIGASQQESLYTIRRMHQDYYHKYFKMGPLIESCYIFMATQDPSDVDIIHLEDVPSGNPQMIRAKGIYWRDYYRARGLLVEHPTSEWYSSDESADALSDTLSSDSAKTI